MDLTCCRSVKRVWFKKQVENIKAFMIRKFISFFDREATAMKWYPNSLVGTFAVGIIAVWNFRRMEFSSYGTFTVENFRHMEIFQYGVFAVWNFRRNEFSQF